MTFNCVILRVIYRPRPHSRITSNFNSRMKLIILLAFVSLAAVVAGDLVCGSDFCKKNPCVSSTQASSCAVPSVYRANHAGKCACCPACVTYLSECFLPFNSLHGTVKYLYFFISFRLHLNWLKLKMMWDLYSFFPIVHQSRRASGAVWGAIVQWKSISRFLSISLVGFYLTHCTASLLRSGRQAALHTLPCNPVQNVLKPL